MLKKKLIKKEISVLHFLILATSKLLIGVSIGLLLAVKFIFLQPYWAIIAAIGLLLLASIMYKLMKLEVKEEIELKEKI